MLSTKLALFLAVGSCLFAQPEVRLSQGAPQEGYQAVYATDGSGNVISVCTSQSIDNTGIRARTKVSISAATNANPVVFTSTGNGFTLNTRPNITISGATVGWVTVNSTFVATVIDANTFSIPIDSTAFGALSGTLVFTTTAPRQTVAEWSVVRYFFSGTNILSRVWLGGTSAYNNKCTDTVSTTNNIQ
jgi:hypothetical protein